MTGSVKPPRPAEQPKPCNYVAPKHEGETRRYAPGWRCPLHTPRVIHQQHDKTT